MKKKKAAPAKSRAAPRRRTRSHRSSAAKIHAPRQGARRFRAPVRATTPRRELYPRARTLSARLLARFGRSRNLLRGERQSRGQTGGIPARRSRAPAPINARGNSSTRSTTASSCSISAAADAAGRARAWSRTPPGIWSPTSNACASIWASSAGWCSADPGAARWRWPMRRRIPSASAKSCCAEFFCCVTPKSAGSISTAPRKFSPMPGKPIATPFRSTNAMTF